MSSNQNSSDSKFSWRVFAEPLYLLLVAVPIAVALNFAGADEMWIFVVSGIAIIPLAGLMGRATESLAASLGAGLGGLLNATLGNAAELIIGLLALRQGPKMFPLVKASLTGSILGNVLLVLGAAMFAGGLRFKRQTFNRTAASMGATLLTLATIGLLIPTLYYYVFVGSVASAGAELERVQLMSEEIAAILAGVYALSLVFSLVTHRNLLEPEDQTVPGAAPVEKPEWGRGTALTVLLVATAAVAWMSEMLIASVEHAAESLGLSLVFVGVIVVAVVGNAAEHSTAVIVALKNKMDLAVTIAVNSGIQIALFVAPVLVFTSMLMGHSPILDLHFTLMEIISVMIAIAVLALVSQDGESHWLEGIMLLAVYAILALAFYHLPETSPAARGIE